MGNPLPSFNSSNDQDCIKKALNSIISNQGTSILDNPKRVKAYLSDNCSGEYKREIALLEYLLVENVHQDLLRQKDSIPYDLLSANITKKILTSHPFDPTLVKYGVDILAVGLGIIKNSRLSQPIPVQDPQTPHNITYQTGSNHQADDLITQGIRLNKSKRFHEALDVLNEILKKDPDNAVALREKGFSISNLGMYEEAIRWYRLSLSKCSRDSSTWTFMGYALSKMRRNRDAIQSYEQAITLDSNNSIAWRGKGYNLEKLNDENGALQCYLNSLDIDPNDPITWNLLGWVKKDYYEKLKAFDKSLSLDPQYFHAMINKAWVLSKLGRFQEALTWYEKVLASDKNNQKAWKEKNYCLKKIRESRYQKRPYPSTPPPQLPKSPTPDNQGIFDKIKGFFK